jgi:hypothetical protein
MNWTGHVLVAPRSRIGEALKREEASRTGVYCLVGDDPEQPSKSLVYVGEADSVADRIRAHVRDESKDFWTRACFITSKDTNLTKAHARYIECRVIELARSADRANLANGNEPAVKSLPESDIADMEFFLAQVQVVLPVVGLDFLRQSPSPITPSSPQPLSDAAAGPVRLQLKSDAHGIEAHALEADGEITVLKGSGATVKEDYVANTYAVLRKQLIDEGRLRLAPAHDRYEFTEDVVFNSPSAAAAVIFNRNTNGRTAWRVTGTGVTLKEWQDAQVIMSDDN